MIKRFTDFPVSTVKLEGCFDSETHTHTTGCVWACGEDRSLESAVCFIQSSPSDSSQKANVFNKHPLSI